MEEYPHKELKLLKRSILKKEIKAINPKTLSKMADSDLALWQSEFEPNPDGRARVAA